MMSKLLRISFDNAVYHITARGNRRDKISHSNLSQGMYYLNTSYANYFAAKYKTIGPLFQGRGQILS